MKFRVISDLHVDVNDKENLQLFDDKDDAFTLVAGDISGDPIIDGYWLTTKTNYHGAFISGNHVVYNHRNKTIDELHNESKVLFPNKKELGRWTYLEKDYIVFEKEKIVVVGGTLWTDYNLYGSQFGDMREVRPIMNDYRWGKVSDDENLSPEWCLKDHNKMMSFLKDICDKYHDYSIIVLSHHCPSIQSISLTYRSSNSNVAYASNLEDFILANPNIKVWCCGHVHVPHTYEIGQCTVLSNPHGYVGLNENFGWTPDKFIFELNEGKLTL